MHSNKTKILITGGAGFVPSSTAEKLLENPKLETKNKIISYFKIIFLALKILNYL